MTHLGRALRDLAIERRCPRSLDRRDQIDRAILRLGEKVWTSHRQREAANLGYLDLGGEG